ncbi:hypothetical protein [Lacunimicrobium album]
MSLNAKNSYGDKLSLLVLVALAGAIFSCQLRVQEPELIKPTLIVAQHALLLDGKKIITWEQWEEILATSPNPAQTSPTYYYTHGAEQSGIEEIISQKAAQLYEKHHLDSMSQGHVGVHASHRFDRILTQKDLLPAPDLLKAGQAIDENQNPVRDAEIVLCTKLDDEEHVIYLNRGRVQYRYEHAMTKSDGEGNFSLHPEKDVLYRVIAIHPEAGFGLLSKQELESGEKLILSKWSTLKVKAPDDLKNSARLFLSTNIPARDGMPAICFLRSKVDPPDQLSGGSYEFKNIIPGYEVTVSHQFENWRLIPAVRATPEPDSLVSIELAPLSNKQQEQLRKLRSEELIDE